MEAMFLIGLFTLLSGLGDAIGFVYAGKVWREGAFDVAAALKSAGGFQFGVFMYWCAARQLNAQGVVAPEVQTTFWFAATIVGVAAMSGQFLRWTLFDRAMGIAVLLGIAGLMLRTARATG
jgi:hypothetical protein